jgi:hypothetical protein
MKTIKGRILKLEKGLGLVETEEARRRRESIEWFLDPARLARLGIDQSEGPEEHIPGLTIEQILNRGRLLASERNHRRGAATASDNGN